MRPFFSVLIASLGGFQFGYNTAVISGALLFLAADFSLSPSLQGFAAGIILLGALAGTAIGGRLANGWGRKGALATSALLFFVGAMIVAMTPFVHFFFLGRVVQGIGLGITSVVTPIYLAEIAPLQRRGIYVSSNQFMITIGILVAYSCNYLFAPEGNWRMMFALAAFPALVQLLGLLLIPESRLQKVESIPWKELFSPMFRPLLIVGTVLSVFQQLTGINAVIYFAPRIFELAGYKSAVVAILATVGIGAVNVFVTLFALWLVDKVRRRSLLFLSLGGMTFSLLALGFAFFSQTAQIGTVAVFALMAYISFFAVGMGPVPWIVLSEIYPLHIRSQAVSFSLFTNWFANYLVVFSFLDIIKLLSAGGAFFLYALIGILAVFFVWKKLPETSRKTL